MTLRSARHGTNVLGGLTALAARIEADKAVGLRVLGLAMVRQVKITLSTPGRGRFYTPRKDAGQPPSPRRQSSTRRRMALHRASAPGQPPAVDTGALRNSIQYEAARGRHRVGTNMRKAVWLEYGTLDAGGKIAPRPFMRPSADALRAHVGREITAVLRRGRGL